MGVDIEKRKIRENRKGVFTYMAHGPYM